MKLKFYTSFIFLTVLSLKAFALGCTSPVITSQPANAVVCLGGNTTFDVVASGPSLTYQWQEDQGAGFVNLSNVAPYSGVTTSTLTITGVTIALSDYLYRCIVSNGCAPDDTSNAAILKINTAPVIFTQPVNTTICEGANGSFDVTTSGSGLSYQWQVNMGAGFVNVPVGIPYSGDTTATLYITTATASMNGYMYQCIVNGACSPAAISNSVTLTVNTLPTITVQPSAAFVCDGNDATFSVTATGTGLTYQWQENQGSGFVNLSNAAPYSGATSATLTITAASAGMNGYLYQCIVSGACAPSAATGDYPLVVYPTYVNYKPVTICQGDSTLFGGSYYSAPGLYPHLFPSVHGCDSLVYLSLNVNSAYLTTTTSIICNGDSVLMGSTYAYTAGTYTYILPTITGCDSTIENTLSVKPSYHFNQSTTICFGDSALVFGVYESIDSVYTQNYSTYLGCDSIYAHTLIVKPNYNFTPIVNICQGDSVLIGGVYISLAGTYSNSYTSIYGCDSVVKTSLFVHPLYNLTQSLTICSNDSVYLAGAYQNTAGMYTDNLTSMYGCDSVMVTTLSVNPAPIVTLNFSLPLCGWDLPYTLTEGTPAGGIYSGTDVTSGIFNPSTFGTYAITYVYSDTVGCSASAMDSLSLVVCEGVAEITNEENISVYPNPFVNSFTITSTANVEAQLHILNVLGEDVYSQILKAGSSEINMSKMAKGIYFIQISTSQNVISKKIIKE
jgi:hypothetical protein